jgi:hypothetical protein
MRLHLSRTGGFGGLGQAASVDEASLAPEERAQLRRLVAESGLWSLPPELPASSPAADRFRYRITAEDGDRRREIRAGEEALPDRLRALVRWLEERARPGPR